MKLKNYLPIIGIIIFIYLLIKLDISRVFNEVANVKIDLLFIAFFFCFISILMETLKWVVIARYQKINIPFFEAVKINLISSFYGFITPAKVGNVIRVNYLKKYSDNNLGKGIGNFILDRMLDLCSLFFLVAVFSFVFKEIFPITFFWYALILLFVSSFFLLIALNKKISRWMLLKIERFVGGLMSEKFKERAKDNFYSFYEDLPKKRYIILFFLINLANWIVAYSVMWFVGLAVGIDISFFYFLAILPIGTLVAQIPITISGLGTREVTIIGLFGLFGVDATKVFSMSIIALFIGSILPAILGFLLSLINKKDKSI